MTTESIAAHEKEQIQEVPTNSTVPIVLRKKGHTENKTPPQIYALGSSEEQTVSQQAAKHPALHKQDGQKRVGPRQV
ncbi:hypothetical protein AYI70_g413 [Smittium culicis]|uniref:Uncharacterized protein n=1 Tax=Smittium culicis TaxID=133412 RepID=A0A1R1YGV3_9FUNG|nr:hypothetical protein AYI70_g413 [Smittium culicis]